MKKKDNDKIKSPSRRRAPVVKFANLLYFPLASFARSGH